jgi:hypothetical protein
VGVGRQSLHNSVVSFCRACFKSAGIVSHGNKDHVRVGDKTGGKSSGVEVFPRAKPLQNPPT